jgi:hygromycin-B 7''-O-kinase
MSTASLRARRVVHDAGLGDDLRLERVDSAVNEVWFAGPYVVRISSSLVTRRLQHELEVVSMLPPSVRYPSVVTYGRMDWIEWLVVDRVPGTVLSRAWLSMDGGERREAVRQLATTLHDLHSVQPPPSLHPPFLEGDSLECPHQLPVARVKELIARASRLPFVNRGLLEAVENIVDGAAGALDDAHLDGLVHGDLHFENVLWDGERITLLDLEFARRGPRDLDLDVLLRFFADPSMHVADDYEHLARQADYGQVPGWMADDYPELFAHPRLMDRLKLYGISYDVRSLLLQPPRGAARTLSPHHPLNRLARVVEGRSHLGWMEW